MSNVIESTAQKQLIEELKDLNLEVLGNQEVAKINGGWYFLANWTSYTRFWSDAEQDYV